MGALLALIAVPGCGGDNDSLPETPVLTPTAETPTALSKSDFISQADDICAEVNSAVGTVDAGTTDAASSLGQKADLYGGMIERIKSLGKAAEDSALSDFFSAGDDLVQAQKDAQLAAERGDDTGLAAAESDASTALSSFQSAAESYGFAECGQGPSAPTGTGGVPATGTPVAPATTTPVPVAPAPTAPVAPAPAPAPPSGGAGTAGGGTAGGGSGGGGSSGSGGIGPG